MASKKIGRIPISPVKSFFVHMLTRDITVQDAILDLLDNCVDGIQRTETNKRLRRRRPYEDYWAKISFSGDRFSIEDNCGGITWDMHEYAFLMGPIKKHIVKGRRAVGTYGIGMKRAIFKIGQKCTVTTHAKDRSYQIQFTPEWMESEDVWDLDAFSVRRSKTFGTMIDITQIHGAIRKEFESRNFLNTFREAVSTHYAYIIEKGFEVFVNGKKVKPKVIRLHFADAKETTRKAGIRPFIYEANHEDVEVFLAVGFTSPIPSKEEADESLENYQEQYSSLEAGWTVICNDRTVLYCDKTSLTGWGVSGVPQYHTQFIAISGIVLFSSEDASLLPTTTTKRGINASSDLYMHVRDKMIEGMKIFTQYTNRWKSKELVEESRKSMRKTKAVDLIGIRQGASRLQMTSTRGAIKGQQFKPVLPRPRSTKTTERISFTRPVKEIRIVSEYIFDVPNKKPRVVGEKCFDLFLEETEE